MAAATAKKTEIRVTVTRRSVMQVAPYESEEASSSVEFSMDGDASAASVTRLRRWPYDGCRKAFPGMSRVLPWLPPRHHGPLHPAVVHRMTCGET